MSFILDALKKSEERRRLEAGDRTPRQRIFALTWSGTQRGPLWLFLALAVLLATLACGWWLRGLSPSPVPVAVPAESITAVPSGQTSPSVASPQAVATESPGQSSPARKADPAPFAPVPAVPVGEAAEAAPPAAAGSRPDAGKTTVPGLRAAIKPSLPAARPAGMRQVSGQIPAALRERIANLNMSVHFYAEDPGQRLVRIANRFLREGRALGDGLVLKEVTPRGVIFSAGGETFEVPRLGEPK
jgi:hypothetical protein